MNTTSDRGRSPIVRIPGELSDRQKDIIARAARGQDTDEIAAAVHLSNRSVKNELAHACGVLNARNRTHLIAIALRLRIIK